MGDAFPLKFLIDGIDRLGKSTLIKNIIEELGYHLVIHYDKPKVLNYYMGTAQMIKESAPEDTDYDESYRQLSPENLARRLYQEETNMGMFDLLRTDTPMIFDRTHLGEMVYAPLYRKYSGEYVYDLEKDYLDTRPYTSPGSTRLILLVSSNTDMLVDDGLGFDPAKKNDEQNLFIDAFNKSQIPNKVMIDVHDGKGGYRPYEDILMDALYKQPK